MAETRTTRLELPYYSSGSDALSRFDFNEMVTNLEEKVAIDTHGTTLPDPGVVGRFWTDDVTKVIFRDDGTAWTPVGRSIVATSSGEVATIVKGVSGQTANLTEWRNSSNVVNAWIAPDGVMTGKRLATTAAGTGNSIDTDNPGVVVGPTSGANTYLSSVRLQSRNNNVAADLFLNDIGGPVTVGNHVTSSLTRLRGASVVLQGATIISRGDHTFEEDVTTSAGSTFTNAGIFNSTGSFRINNKVLTIGPTPPASPGVGDVWITVA